MHIYVCTYVHIHIYAVQKSLSILNDHDLQIFIILPAQLLNIRIVLSFNINYMVVDIM